MYNRSDSKKIDYILTVLYTEDTRNKVVDMPIFTSTHNLTFGKYRTFMDLPYRDGVEFIRSALQGTSKVQNVSRRVLPQHGQDAPVRGLGQRLKRLFQGIVLLILGSMILLHELKIATALATIQKK